MSEHWNAVRHIAGSPGHRRRRLLLGAAGFLGASGLLLGGVGVPASAEDVQLGGTPSASATLEEGCATAVVDTGELDGSVDPQGDGGQLQAAGEGTATASVCRDDLGDPPPDPGGFVPDDLDDVVPSDLEDVLPEDPGGSVGGELVGEVTGALEDGLPGEGGGPLPGDPGGDPPGDVDDVVPGGPGGLVPGGLPIDPAGLLRRVVDIIPGSIHDGDVPGGNGGSGTAPNGAVNGSVSESVAVGGEAADAGAPAGQVIAAEFERGVSLPAGSTVSGGGTLPRTGGGLGDGVLRLAALLGLGRAVLGQANRRRRTR